MTRSNSGKYSRALQEAIDLAKGRAQANKDAAYKKAESAYDLRVETIASVCQASRYAHYQNYANDQRTGKDSYSVFDQSVAVVMDVKEKSINVAKNKLDAERRAADAEFENVTQARLTIIRRYDNWRASARDYLDEALTQQEALHALNELSLPERSN